MFDVDRTQADVAQLLVELQTPEKIAQAVDADVSQGTLGLKRIVAKTDGLQVSADEATSTHHFANTLFNDMRGGVYAEDYAIRRDDFTSFVHGANRECFEAHRRFLETLDERTAHREFLEKIGAQDDPVLIRLSYEYLPLTFSRRHGDPSRPWNKFDIQVRDNSGAQLLGFQGNWRDIFQNWEALSLSYPGYVESIIAKFVNASTVDGYNPYRITKQGIDWEEPEPQNPWAGIGYWGDHQIIYLLKLLELSRSHHPERLSELLTEELFTYANVPYRIKPFEEICENPRDTILFDHRKNDQIKRRAEEFGSDARLLLERHNSRAPRSRPQQIYRVNLLEKLLVASLSKMGNFVPGGGIWMNTQRPEWNDANNALVGFGVSMVTLYYSARFFRYLEDAIAPLGDSNVELSAEVLSWIEGTIDVLEAANLPAHATVSDELRGQVVYALGEQSSEYRDHVYERGFSRKEGVQAGLLLMYVRLCRSALEHSVALGKREGGLYHAYNLLRLDGKRGASVEPLYEMLEGQVAALSAGVLSPDEVVTMLDSLRGSAMYREDQDSYMLYPNRQLSLFLDKNRIPSDVVSSSPLAFPPWLALKTRSSLRMQPAPGDSLRTCTTRRSSGKHSLPTRLPAALRSKTAK